MNAFKVYASPDYIGAVDLDGKEYNFTIDRVGVEIVKAGPADKGKQRVVLTLKGAKKKLILNKTNVKVIIAAYGNETDGWIGKELVLFPSTCNAFGLTNVPCVRVRIREHHEAEP